MGKSDLFTIGQIAKLFHLSTSLLRHYEKIGLLYPDYIDPETGYRYYSSSQFEALNTIRYLRLLDTPLEQISHFLQNRDLDKIHSLLLQQKQEISRKRHELETIENKISRRLNQLEQALEGSLDTVRKTKLPERRMVFLRRKLDLHSNFTLEPLIIQQLELDQNDALIFLGKVGIQMEAERLRNNQFDQYDSIFLLLDPEDTYRGETITLAEQDAFCLRFAGSHAQAPEQYEKLAKAIREQGYQISGPSQEITIIDSGFTQDKDRYVTEICIPVTKASS